MIPQTNVSWQSASWQELIADSIRDPKQLLAILELDAEEHGLSLDEMSDFPLRAPRPYVERIEKGNPQDPLLLQILPQEKEQQNVPGYVSDPVGDLPGNHVPGLIHKYYGRVLLVVGTQCAVNCRYCFRREFPYAENRLDKENWQNALAYIADDPSITEVIFSGGDPLSVGDRQLAWLVEQLANIPHVQRLRIHSRLPVVIPNRITDQAINWMTATRIQPVMVIHCNHANELSGDVAVAVNKLRQAGIIVLNQSVLLKGINDSIAIQEALCTGLFEIGVLPYYLHVMDKVNGAAHFDLKIESAKQLIAALRARMPGYLVPRLVREISGASSKQILG